MTSKCKCFLWFFHNMQCENSGSACWGAPPPTVKTKSNLFRLEAAGLPCPAWGVGSTPSCSHQTDGLSSLTEVCSSVFPDFRSFLHFIIKWKVYPPSMRFDLLSSFPSSLPAYLIKRMGKPPPQRFVLLTSSSGFLSFLPVLLETMAYPPTRCVGHTEIFPSEFV